MKEWKDDMDGLRGCKDDLREYIQLLRNQKLQLEEEIEALRLKKEGMSSAQETRATTALCEEIELLKSKLAHKEKRLISSEKELETFQSENTNLKQMVEHFQSENANLKQRVEYLDQARKKLLNDVLVSFLFRICLIT